MEASGILPDSVALHTSKNDGSMPPPKKPGSKAQGRKRTKTGCLTCRKRRIKCGEERPTCQNCTKSKRQCEGYNQRVVFKDPLSAFRPSLSKNVSFMGPISGSVALQVTEPSQQRSSQSPLPIAPKPSGSLKNTSQVMNPLLVPGTRYASASDGEQGIYVLGTSTAQDRSFGAPRLPRQDTRFPSDSKDVVDHPLESGSKHRQATRDHASHYDFNALVKTQSGDGYPTISPQINPLEWTGAQASGSQLLPQEVYHDSNRPWPGTTPFYHSYPVSTSWKSTITGANEQSLKTQFQGTVDQNTELNDGQDIKQRSDDCLHRPQGDQQQTSTPQLMQSRFGDQKLMTGQEYHILGDEDDPFDVSDEDFEMGDYNQSGSWHGGSHNDHLQRNDLGIVVALQAGQDTRGLQIRSFTSFIDRPDMLATYIPSSQASPLRDVMAARIFCHFINVTAPSISMFERNPANPSLIFQGQPIPKTQQHIWTYTFPTLALQNPALLHAILALGSLHIAKLQKAPITASLKHYALGLRGIAKSVALQSRKGHPATLAASLLLSFYECWGGDHQKWSNHLLGGKHLIGEIDFAGMTKYIRKIKMQQRRESVAHHYQAHQESADFGGFMDIKTQFQTSLDDVDENIVGMLMGKKLRYDQYGHVIEESALNNEETKEYTEKDLEVYETQRDLFWWYCKMDVYQSILGGGRLFLDYSLWSHCPPRAPLGRLSAVYGTFDHLILLLGRYADFASKDLKRKRLAIKANGGQWRPPGVMGLPHQPAQKSQEPPSVPQMPSFSGMLPVGGQPKLPMGFEEYREASPSSTSSEEIDLEIQKAEAEEEWQDIRTAFGYLEDHFGEEFQALGPEFSAPIQTPFGTALQYRTYGIAGIWMNFYMGLIACQRAHPSMPPAAMMASGIAARQTASFANEIGRIAAGLAPDCSRSTQVSPGVGAALIESAVCLFIAGVQFQDAAQRAWTVNRLRDISRLTGWETALAIAIGCEKSWMKAAELGRGPPYTKTTEERVAPDVWQSSERNIDTSSARPVIEERRIVVDRAYRAHYALGILGVEEDFERLDLDNDEAPKVL